MPNNENLKRPIFIVSGGRGVAGHTMVQSLIIQYPDNKIPVNIIPNVQSREKIEEVVKKVKNNNGLLCHTMVNGNLRKILVTACENNKVDHIDFMGPLADFLENELGLKSVNVPGLYRRINAQYFDRIEAIEFAMNHDDGLNHNRLLKSEIVLIGLSRSGKTPLSVYMSMYGWKVANVPIVMGIEPPEELFQIDPQRVFALKISPQSLIAQRYKRLAQMNNLSNSKYIDSIAVNQEIRNFNLIVERGGFTTINVTNKPIETSANEIIGIVSERFGSNLSHDAPVS
ncbi:pyruvate, water dikinase regulatory protein [Saccharicrinis sp. FJH2]|uniref:pyruvate, water dikinase regulatory protein n=1 Tax=Saccharicrinis sp. FJH65 TaxID=3344659 RepID=UPI0035F43FE8